MNSPTHSFHHRGMLVTLLSAFFFAACIRPAPVETVAITPDTETPIPRIATNTTSVMPTSSPTQPSPTSTPEPYATPVELSIRNPKPTPTPVSPFGGPLSTEGPWMLYSLGPKRGEWYLVNPDGSGRVLLAPEGTGAAFIPPHPGADRVAFKKGDQLSIYKLPSLELILTIPLLSDPELQRAHPDDLARANASVRHEPPHWSPDGRYLAFVAAIDAPSSDVYIYDSQSSTVRRLSDEPDHADGLTWSPDSRWLVYETTSCRRDEHYVYSDGCWNITYVTRAVSISGTARRLYEPHFGSSILGWSTHQSFFTVAGTPNLAAHTIRHVDLGTGHVSVHFRGWWWSPTVYDPVSDFLVVPHQPFTVPEGLRTTGLEEGLYILTPSSDQPLKVDTSPIDDDFSLQVMEFNIEWSATHGRIILTGMACNGEDHAVPSILKNGKIECLRMDPASESGTLHWSPDGRWALNASGSPTLLNQQGEILFQSTRGRVHDVSWRPDSLGVFFTWGNKLAYLSAPEAELVIVDDRYPYAIHGYDRPLIWVGVD